MMYARTMSWISRKVSPTFLFLTSTILGVSYSKRKEDTFSMNFCPMAAPGLCRSLPPAPLLAVPRVRWCPLSLGQLLCLQRGGNKRKEKCYWSCSVHIWAVGFPPLRGDGVSTSYKLWAGSSLCPTWSGGGTGCRRVQGHPAKTTCHQDEAACPRGKHPHPGRAPPWGRARG